MTQWILETLMQATFEQIVDPYTTRHGRGCFIKTCIRTAEGYIQKRELTIVEMQQYLNFLAELMPDAGIQSAIFIV